MPASAFSPISASLVVRPRLVPSRTVDRSPRLHGEKPFEQLVIEAFDGPVLRLSRRIKLLETADDRRIRRGDALDVIESVQREVEEEYAIRPPGKIATFAKRFGAFAAAYVVIALAWCLLI
jgi:hypothetical protein